MSFFRSIVCRCRVLALLRVVVTIAVPILVTPLTERATAQSAGTFSSGAAEMMGGGNGGNPQKQAGKWNAKKKTPKNSRTKTTSSLPIPLPRLGIQSKQGATGYLKDEIYKVIQVCDDENALIYEENSEWRFWLHSSVVADLKEGQNLGTIKGRFTIAGKKKYTLVTGAISTIDLVEDAPPEKKAEEKRPPKQAPLKVALVSRTWTNAETGRQIEAQYVSMIAGNVKLKKADGTIVTISIEKLSKDDQDWIRKGGTSRMRLGNAER